MKSISTIVALFALLGLTENLPGAEPPEKPEESFMRLLSGFESAVLTLENRNGGEALRASYRSRLEALLGKQTEKKKHQAIREEFSKISSVYPIDRGNSPTFSELADLQKTFDEELVKIRKKTADSRLKLKKDLKAQLEVRISRANGEEKEAWLRMAEAQFPGLLQSKAPDEGRSGGDEGRAVNSFPT